MRRLNIFLIGLCLCTHMLHAQIADILPSREVLQREFGAHDREAFNAPEKVFYPETWFHFIGGNV